MSEGPSPKVLFRGLLPIMALLLTGCPSDHFVLDMTPRGEVMERKLLFYRVDGTTTNGAPNYQNFPLAKLAEITKIYGPGNVTQDGDRHTANGQFAGRMPQDVGGAGSYTNVATTLGSAGFYVERFRGDDDVAKQIEKRQRAADQLADLVLGWSRMALRREPGYENLRQFLDVDFRRDLRNLGLYAWMLQTSSAVRMQTPEEFAVRFGQYLAERGYLELEDLPKLFRMTVLDDSRPLMKRIQRLAATKLGVAKSAPLPHSLAFLANPVQLSQSWEDYLKTTDLYRTRVEQWQKEKFQWRIGLAGRRLRGLYDPRFRTNGAAVSPAAPSEPQASAVADELAQELLKIDIFGADDHVTVRLSLPSAPAHTNGKWDETRKQVVWESDLAQGENGVRVPAFCYANWSQPDEKAQTQHFGKVVLKGDNLSQYCLWRGALNLNQAAEWETFLATLQPGQGWKEKIEAFRFADEPVSGAANRQPNRAGASDFPRQLFDSALEAAQPGSTATKHP